MASILNLCGVSARFASRRFQCVLIFLSWTVLIGCANCGGNHTVKESQCSDVSDIHPAYRRVSLAVLEALADPKSIAWKEVVCEEKEIAQGMEPSSALRDRFHYGGQAGHDSAEIRRNIIEQVEHDFDFCRRILAELDVKVAKCDKMQVFLSKDDFRSCPSVAAEPPPSDYGNFCILHIHAAKDDLYLTMLLTKSAALASVVPWLIARGTEGGSFTLVTFFCPCVPGFYHGPFSWGGQNIFWTKDAYQYPGFFLGLGFDIIGGKMGGAEDLLKWGFLERDCISYQLSVERRTELLQDATDGGVAIDLTNDEIVKDWQKQMKHEGVDVRIGKASLRLSRSSDWTRRREGGDLYEDPVESYNRWLKTIPPDAESAAWRGYVRKEKGDTDGAVADFEMALEIAPGDWPYRQEIEQELDKLRKQK